MSTKRTPRGYANPERDAIADHEATRDPIFLFQRRRWIVTGCPDGWEIDEEGDCVRTGRSGDDPEVLSLQQLSQHCYGEWDVPCAIPVWETESVYLTREEGEAYGKSRHYNYRDGWRVYCVCAEGRLGEVLKDHG
jgi:hypothetical protein